MIKIYENEMPMPVRNDGKRSVSEYTTNDWAHKVKEELIEACTAGSPEEQALEIADIITTCTSWLESTGNDFEKRKQLFRQTNCKNQGRGYLEYMER